MLIMLAKRDRIVRLFVQPKRCGGTVSSKGVAAISRSQYNVRSRGEKVPSRVRNGSCRLTRRCSRMTSSASAVLS